MTYSLNLRDSTPGHFDFKLDFVELPIAGPGIDFFHPPPSYIQVDIPSLFYRVDQHQKHSYRASVASFAGGFKGCGGGGQALPLLGIVFEYSI